MASSVEQKKLAKKSAAPLGSAQQRVLGKGDATDLDKREILAALRALKRGEFNVRLPDGLDGIDGQICETFNELTSQLDGLGEELKDVRQAVGREGRTKRRARRHNLQGGFGGYVSTVNDLLDDTIAHTDEMARVIVAVGNGDLAASMDEYGLETPLTGEFLRHAKAVNGVIHRLNLLSTELTRVAREVGIEGKLGVQAIIPGASGAWRELTDGVNLMAINLTSQVREIARVTTAVARGDLTKTINVEVRGELLELKDTINTMVHQLSSFTDEVTRVAREVGTEGKLGGQAQVHGVSGVWRELTENVNSMANNLTLQVRNIADVSTAIADGDLSRKITVEVRGELLELKNTINTMVDQLSSFADEVTRVAREVGSEGILGGTAEVAGVSGVWQELTLNVNGMATNLTNQVRNIAEVTTAIALGDLGKKITVDAKGEILQLKSTINSTVDKLNHFSNEVTRVARLVGTEGTLGVQASVTDASGIWKELTDNVNLMADNLTNQVRSIAEVTTAVANGDLSKKITVEVKGEISELKNTINQMVDSLNFFAREVTRLAREVGTEGTLGGQAQVHNMSGMWLELTSSVNSMASNLTGQVRNISEVANAVARGDLSRKITVDARGEVLELKVTLNDMVDQLNSLGAEVTRVAREVGVEGKLGGQALVLGGRGVWKELTDNVNLMASNLTNQVRDIAEVTTSVARGNLTRKIVVDARGEILELKNTVNTMVDQLSSFAAEVTRLASDVGVEGKLGGQADVRGVSGTWRDLTDAVNSMASNLTVQVRSISEVATAIAEGDLERKIAVDARGEILELKETINTMVDQLSSFAEEVSRVAREVGTDGRLGGQASVEGVRGTWKELTDNVNSMASNITYQVRDIATVATAIAGGDLSQKITVQVAGELAELKSVFNTMVDQLSSFADQVTRLARDVGVEGVLGGQAEVRGVSGIWKELTDNVNLMAENLTNQVRDIAHVTTAVATGDLSKKIKVEVKGELLELKNTVNTMVEQLSSFADEVTRVAREVGTEGTLGGQAEVKGVSGTWRELTDNVNLMAENITEQVRGIARVVTAVARGDLKQELRLDSKGEIATLVITINNMIVTLSTFADQVTGVARDVGVEGRLGGQADVPGAAGVWRDLTNNVNELAGNLTRQVRAIGDVATAVTEGDLTQKIDVEARGEVALLKDNLNEMISALARTTQLNEEQDWLKSNLARFSRILQGQRDLITVTDRVLSELSQLVESQHGAFYMARAEDGEVYLELFASYAFTARKNLASRYALGESMVGQAAREKKRILVTEVPSDYVQISSALGHAAPLNLVIVPVLFEGAVKGVIELASFHRYTKIQLDFIDQLLESLGIVVATIEATMRTDDLLRQSQSMGEELQTQQEELQQTNEELEEKARQLTTQRDEVERKNQEVGLAKLELEEKAEQLALTSKYKSQFLANMSHELRTPLNSLLILSRQLAENGEGNLSPKQVEYASTVYQAGADLLSLINEILDLAKVESGTMAVEPSEVRLGHLQDYLDRSFRSMAEEKGLQFVVEAEGNLPTMITTDDMRLKQVLRNLLSNAIKFTEAGEVRVRMRGQTTGAGKYIAFDVSDTGIGIEEKKQGVVFEAFQQADGSTSRRYGGTGLGLSISREIAYLLGGQITLTSVLGQGSTFTLVLPSQYVDKNQSTPTPPRVLNSRSNADDHPSSSSLTLHNRPPTPMTGAVDDDRTNVQPGDRILLIIEDDKIFAEILLQVARERDFKGIVALSGSDGFELAKHHHPDSICLDLVLPDMDGWVLLDRLKHDAATRHIPIHIISGAANERRAYECGAVAVIQKPVDKDTIDAVFVEMQALLDQRIKRVLLVEDDANQRKAIIALIGDDDVKIEAVSSGEDALAQLEASKFDCMVLDLSLPGMDGLELIQALREKPALRRLPVIVYTGKELSKEERNGLSRLAETVIVKDVRSPDRLIAETALFLHRAESRMSADKRQILRSLVHGDPALQGKHVLVVDDDVRNLYAITAVLEQHAMNVLHAENGHEAIKAVNEHAELDVILMDIMMPEMDGFEAMRRIRKDPTKRKLPIIALTAKAMKGDREKCIEAGASDYVTKPVDSDQLISLLRVWLYG